jgi:hypothetical protein
MKVAAYMPWDASDGNKAALKLVAKGGQYLACAEEWFRGVWIDAPENILDADYTKEQAKKRLSAGGNGQFRLTQQTTAGWTEGGFAEKAGFSVGEGEEEEEEEEAAPPDGDEANGEGEGEASYHPQSNQRSMRQRIRSGVKAGIKAGKKKKR